MELNKIYCETNLETIARMRDSFIDSIVTDPPYELGFMGKKWDSSGIAYNVELWKECFRVLKPGGYLLAFGGTRTSHRMVCAIEDAGFEIRDSILWLYGSGFPKSLDISKAIDKEKGIKRDLQQRIRADGKKSTGTKMGSFKSGSVAEHLCYDKNGISEDAKKYEGWGTALKPAHEPICVARKPIAEKTIAENVLKYGTGGINIDRCRIDFKSKEDFKSATFGRGTDILGGNYVGATHSSGKTNIEANPLGRFPANVILDEFTSVLLDEQTGILKSGAMSKNDNCTKQSSFNALQNNYDRQEREPDEGGASRFFYIAKADRQERNESLHQFNSKPMNWSSGTQNPGSFQSEGTNRFSQNFHPTVKPIRLIQYLQRLVTPKGGLTYDPFGGSGTAALAAINEDFEWILSEMNAEYCDIANKRIYDKAGLFK